MYLTSLRIKNVKLLRDVPLAFTTSDGKPRMWTVLLGDNGLCKSTILQCIALAAAGPKLGSALVRDASLLHRSGSSEAGLIEATFKPSSKTAWHPALFHPAALTIGLELQHNRSDLRPTAATRESAAVVDDIRARKESLPNWFVAGYGVGRLLPEPGEVPAPPDPRYDRLEGLFVKHHKMLGTDFYDVLQKRENKRLALRYSQVLRDVLLSEHEGEKLFPLLSKVILQGKNGVKKLEHLLESRRMVLDLDGTELKLPATSLSDGYQSMLAWIADLLGHAFLEQGDVNSPADLRGVVLLDELDLHLHPRWQRRVVPLLRSVFKNVQFIVTTHSPLVVAGAHASEIIRLRREGDVVTEDPNEREPGFQTATQLLTNYFDVPIAARKELVEQRRELRSLLALESVTASQRRRRDTLKRELAPYRALPTDFDGGTEA